MAEQQKTKVVIIGGGFGGVFTARTLHRLDKNIDIELISDRNYFVFQPLLPEVAAGTINTQDAVTPLRQLLKHEHVRLAEVVNIDPEKKQVFFLQGRRRIVQSVTYDHLVIATGQVTDLTRFPGFCDHSLTMKDLSDAFKLRNHLISCMELADITPFDDIREQSLTFVVAGGGFSGVETMGELQEMVHRVHKFYPNVREEQLRFVLLQRGNRLLPELPEKLSEYTLENFKNRGIEVWLETEVACATPTSVQTRDGRTIPTTTLITTIGNGPSSFIRNLDIPEDNGKIVVDEFLQVEKYPNTWAIGDVAKTPLPVAKSKKNNQEEAPRFAPPTAQFALREADCVANNIVRSLKQKKLKTFKFSPLGMLASLGNYRAVADLFGVKISGFWAWVLWRGFYISILPGISTRIRVSINWFFDYFMPRDTVFLDQGNPSACRYRRYTQGDVLFEAKQILDGFYIVVEGKLEMRIVKEDGSEMIKTIGPGEHWGEWILDHHGRTTGTVSALEDTKVLVLDKEDFLKLKHCLPGFAEYFDHIDPKRYSQVNIKDV